MVVALFVFKDGKRYKKCCKQENCMFKRTGLKATSQRAFRPGYIFGAEANNKCRRILVFLSSLDELVLSQRLAWRIHSTPLERYAGPVFAVGDNSLRGPYPNVKEIIADAAQVAAAKGETIRVLDIGVGTGKGLNLEFFKQHGIAFDCTTLTPGVGMAPEIRKIVKFRQAAGLHRGFSPSSYNFVLSHYGVHSQLCAAVENALFLLKPGGEILFSGQDNEKQFQMVITHGTPRYGYTILEYDYGAHQKHPDWYLWLKKTG